MGLNDRQTLKRLTPVLFLLATILLVVGIFLSVVNPANAQSATATVTPPAAGTATSGSGSVPVTGSLSPDQLQSSDLTGWNVVDRSGTQVGTVNSLLLDMRNAAVCSSTTSSTGTSGATTPTASSSTGSAVASCAVTGGKSQTDGLVRYIVVDRSGIATTGGAASAAPTTASSSLATSAATAAVGAATPVATTGAGLATTVATSAATSSAPGGNLVPVPWSLARFDMQNRQVILDMDAAAFNNAPSFSFGNIPDLFTGTESTMVTSFWSTPSNLRAQPIPATGGTGAQAATTAPTNAATAVPSATVAPTVAASATTAATTAATAAAIPTTVSTATSVSSGASATSAATATSAAPVGTATVPATVAAPAAGAGTPTALVPVTGVDLSQAANAAAAQQRMILDMGIVVVGLGLLVLGLLFRSRKV